MNQSSYETGRDQQYHQNYQTAPLPTNGKAIAALVLGILSIIIVYIGFILGIITIVLASQSFKEMKRTGERGNGMAVAGLVCGIVATSIYGIVILIAIITTLLYGLI